MNHMLKYSVPNLILLFLSLFSNAQENEVSVQFVSFPISDKSKPIELLLGEGKSIEVELPTTCLSPVYKLPALSHWSLGKMVVGADDEKVFKSYGKTKSTGTNKQLILVIRKGANYEDGFEMIPLKYDAENFGGGKYFMMNATTVDIGVELGSMSVGLKPYNYKIVKPKASKVVNGNKQLYTKIYFRHKRKMKAFYSSTWRLNDKARSLVFFYHEPHNRRIRTHTIRNYIR